jgi:hypothetical protein
MMALVVMTMMLVIVSISLTLVSVLAGNLIEAVTAANLPASLSSVEVLFVFRLEFVLSHITKAP